MGLLESWQNLKFQPDSNSMGLLSMGAQMLANSGPSVLQPSFGRTAGQALQGYLGGRAAFEDRQAAKTQEQIEQELMQQKIQAAQAQLAAQTPEAQRQKAFADAQTNYEIGQKYPTQGASPSGFRWGSDGSLEPIPVRGMGSIQNMPEYQMQLQQAKLNQQLGIAQVKDLNKTAQFEMSDGTKRVMTNREALAIQNRGQAGQPQNGTAGQPQNGQTGLGIAPLVNNDQIVVASQPKGQPAMGFGQTTEQKAFQTQAGKNTAEQQKDLFLRKQALPGAVANIDNRIADIDRLTGIQKDTLTGPVLGNPVTAQFRKTHPGKWGTDIQALDNGYSKLAMDIFISLKEQGATFGSLTEGEADWIKDIAPKLSNDEDINLEMLASGKRLLQERKRMMYQSAGVPMPETGGANDITTGWSDAKKAEWRRLNGK